jgi:hypothetical protein
MLSVEAVQETFTGELAVTTRPVGTEGAMVSGAVVPGMFVVSSAPPPPQPERPKMANRTANAKYDAFDTTTPRLLLASSFCVTD